MKKITFLLAALMLLVTATASAQQFKATHLKKAAMKLKLDSAALATETLPATKVLTVGNQVITMRKDENGVVEHIGIPLFIEEMRQLQPSPIYDYLEFTVLDRLFKINENTLTQEDLKFEKGNLTALSKVIDTADGCSIENMVEKLYRVKWTKGNAPIVVVTFPINYELLANSSRKELELNFIRDIKKYHDNQPLALKDYSEKMVPTDDPEIFVVPGNHYLINEINDNKFFSTSTEENETGKLHKLGLLFDRHAPKESLTNLMLEYDMPVDSALIELEFVLGNYKRDTLTVTMRDWMSFCQKQGLQPYFGFEDNENGTITGTLIMNNKQSGYDHIIAVRAVEDELFADHPLVHAKVHLFTPSSNVRNLFGKATKSNRPRIKYSR